MSGKKAKKERKENRENPILHLAYKIDSEPGEFRAKTLMKKGYGGADGLFIMPFLCDKDGDVVDVEAMSMNGITKQEVSPKEQFKLWVIMSSMLAANEELDEELRAFAAQTYMQVGIYLKQIAEERRRKKMGILQSAQNRPPMTELEAYMAARDVDPIGALSDVTEEEAQKNKNFKKAETCQCGEGEDDCGGDEKCSCGKHTHSTRGTCDC